MPNTSGRIVLVTRVGHGKDMANEGGLLACRPPMRMSAAPTLLLPGNERRHRARLPRHDELNLLGGPKGVPLLLMGVVNKSPVGRFESQGEKRIGPRTVGSHT